jgi:hypothetical protein
MRWKRWKRNLTDKQWESRLQEDKSSRPGKPYSRNRCLSKGLESQKMCHQQGCMGVERWCRSSDKTNLEGMPRKSHCRWLPGTASMFQVRTRFRYLCGPGQCSTVQQDTHCTQRCPEQSCNSLPRTRYNWRWRWLFQQMKKCPQDKKCRRLNRLWQTMTLQHKARKLWSRFHCRCLQGTTGIRRWKRHWKHH